MWYVYVIRDITNKRLYTGFTSDLHRRLDEHNAKVGCQYTSRNGPFELIFYESYKDKRDATKAELFWKSGYGREVLKDKIKYSLNPDD